MVSKLRNVTRDRLLDLWRQALEQDATFEVQGKAPVSETPGDGGRQSVAGKGKQTKIGLDQLLELLADQDAATLSNRMQWASLNVDIAADEAAGLLEDAAKLALKAAGTLPQMPRNNMVTVRISFDQNQARETQRVTGKTGASQGRTRGLLHTVTNPQAPDQVDALGPHPHVPFRPAGEHTEPPVHVSVIID